MEANKAYISILVNDIKMNSISHNLDEKTLAKLEDIERDQANDSPAYTKKFDIRDIEKIPFVHVTVKNKRKPK